MLPKLARGFPVVATFARTPTGFALRLSLSLTLALVVVGLVQYHIASRQTLERLVAVSLEQHARDAVDLQDAFDDVDQAGETPWGELGEALDIIGARPGVQEAALLSPIAVIMKSQGTDDVTAPLHDDHHAQEVISRGAAHGGLDVDDDDDGRQSLEFDAPVNLPVGRLSLHVEQDAAGLWLELTQIRRSTARLLLLGLLAGVAVFYLAGGRSLTAQHRTAVNGARTDGLTGLGNHRAFQEELQRAVTSAARQQRRLTLALIDIDDFKAVNDRVGHRGGDEVLAGVAQRLTALRLSDRSFRVGGDEFAVILEDSGAPEAHVAMERLRRSFAGRHADATISVGLTAFGDPGDDGEAMHGRADAALYEAKRHGRNNVTVYDERVQAGSTMASGDEQRALRSLLADGRMNVAFQPICAVDGEQALGFEALARPPLDAGFDGPARAFELAEASGRGPELDQLCRDAALSRAGELPAGALLFLNVCPQSLGSPGLTADGLLREVRSAGLSPDRIVLEITERALERRDEVVREALALRDAGFGIALDDVGAGNAGLEMLRQLPIDYLKVDREIVARSLTHLPARAVLAGLLTFASLTGAKIVLEGIETVEMLEMAMSPDRLIGAPVAAVHAVQGYLLGRPAAHPTAPAPFPRRLAVSR